MGLVERHQDLVKFIFNSVSITITPLTPKLVHYMLI